MKGKIPSTQGERENNKHQGRHIIRNRHAGYKRVAFYTNPRDSGTRDEEEEEIN